MEGRFSKMMTSGRNPRKTGCGLHLIFALKNFRS